MEQSYRTIRAEAAAEFVERRSRFIGSIRPCRTEEEAAAFLEEKRKQYWDASHNVYAYVLRAGNKERCSDDGEPQGTAGRPVLDVLQKEHLVDVCVVATRYFGGILLGTGGLTRAYSHTSKIAVDAAQIVQMCVCRRYRLEFAYPLYGKISYLLPDFSLRVLGTDFADRVAMEVLIRGEEADAFCKQLTELTNGQLEPQLLEEQFADLPVSG